MARTATPTGFLRATTSFSVTVDGVAVPVATGDTIPVDHPWASRFPEYFEPFTPTYAWRDADPIIEQATAAPGEKRGR